MTQFFCDSQNLELPGADSHWQGARVVSVSMHMEELAEEILQVYLFSATKGAIGAI